MSAHGSPRTGPARDVLLLRHGQSEWNAEGRWQGRADSPLSDAGRTEAAELAGHLGRQVHVDGGPVWASPLARARETAEIVARCLGVDVVVDEQLVERHAGAWQGLTTATIDERWPGDRLAGRWPVDAEPFDAVAQRGRAALVRVASMHPPGATPVVIAHGGLIRAVLQTVGGRDRRIGNVGGTWFAVGGEQVLAGAAFPTHHEEATAARGTPDDGSARRPGVDDDRL